MKQGNIRIIHYMKGRKEDMHNNVSYTNKRMLRYNYVSNINEKMSIYSAQNFYYL